MSKKKARPLLGQVKEAIDFVYEISNAPEGYRGSFNEYSAAFCKAISILVQRGILSKERNPKNHRSFVYKWIASMHPTETLYKSVTQEMRDRQHKYDVKSREKRREESLSDVFPDIIDTPDGHIIIKSMGVTPKAPEKKPEPTPAPTNKEYVTDLDGFSSQELWDELKKRGYDIEGDRIVKKAYLN